MTTEAKQTSMHVSEQIFHRIERNITGDLFESGMTSDDLPFLLGYIVQPYNSVDSPVLHGNEREEYIGCTNVLKALMAFFSGKENLNMLPEKVRGIVLECLFQLNKSMLRVSEYSDVLWECGNLYMVKSWGSLSDQQKESLKDWYNVKD